MYAIRVPLIRLGSCRDWPDMTRCGVGASEWFIDGVDCLKIALGVADLHAAMARLIAMPRQDRTVMRQRAQATALRLFRFEDALSRIEAVLKDAARPCYSEPRSMEAALTILTEIWRSRPHG